MRSLLPVLLLTSALPLPAHEGDHHHQAAEMTAAAGAFLATLDPAQQKQALIPFADAERENWHFVPMSERRGLSISALNPGQLPLAYAFLGTGLSPRGLRTAGSIMNREQYLAVKENNPRLRDPQKYFLSVFGEPAPAGPWGWRFEGHHLSLNYTLLPDGTFAFTPAFFGTNPAELRDGPLKGSRPLGDVEDAARDLTLRIAARFPNVVFADITPRDIITSQDRVAGKLQQAGISTTRLNQEEGRAVRDLVALVAGFVTTPTAEQAQGDPVARAIFDEKCELRIGWAGSLKKGEAHYFRIQGNDILVEYANTQDNANHAHLVLRCPGRDFGRDLLKEHIEAEH